MTYRHRLLYYRVAPIYIRYKKRKQSLQIWSLCHSRDRIVAASRPLQIYTVSAIPIGAVLACFIFVFYLVGLFFFVFLFWFLFSNIMCFVINFG
jgi:hypothetical protein